VPVLYVNPLDLWLMLLGTSLLVVAYWVYLNYISGRPEDYRRSVNRNLAFFFLPLGLYAFIAGLRATFTWPPGADPWAVFGVAMLLLGV
jgi:putative membrane protein